MTSYTNPDRRPEPIRLVLADGQLLILEALEALFREAGGFAVLAHCLHGDEVLEAVRRQEPDILVLGLCLLRMDGLEVVRRLAGERRATRVVLVADGRDEREIGEALALGVAAVVLREMPASSLLRCIRAVHAGEPWFEKRSTTRMIQKLVRAQGARSEAEGVFTPRELEVVRMVCKGLRNRAIAAALGITENTVKVHLGRIYAKLGAHGRLDLYRFAADRGLL